MALIFYGAWPTHSLAELAVDVAPAGWRGFLPLRESPPLPPWPSFPADRGVLKANSLLQGGVVGLASSLCLALGAPSSLAGFPEEGRGGTSGLLRLSLCFCHGPRFCSSATGGDIAVRLLPRRLWQGALLTQRGGGRVLGFIVL